MMLTALPLAQDAHFEAHSTVPWLARKLGPSARGA